MNGKTETLDMLHGAYDALTKAGKNSLSKAYAFGAVVNALHGLFTYTQLAEEIGVTVSTVSMYAKLYRRYPTERALTDMSEELGTYDVGKLAAEDAASSVPMRFVPHCNSCGSYDVSKEKKPAEVAKAIREEVEKAHAAVPQAKFASV